MSRQNAYRIASLALCLFGATVASGGSALAQSFPERPIKWVVPYPPGGGGDIFARFLAQKVSETIGRQVIIENRAGAAGIIGSEAVAKSAPDGYTLIFGTNVTHAIVVSLYSKLPYDAVKDFAPVSNLVAATNVLVVPPSLPVSSVGELIALAKSKPGTLNYASAGSGSNAHLAMELLKSMVGLDIVHTPYKGVGPAVTDLLAGHVQMLISNVPPVEGHIKTGKLKALASTGTARSPALPGVPTVAESGVPGYESDAWWGVLAPAGTPRPTVAKLNAEFVRALGSPDVKARLVPMGLEAIGSSPEAFATTIKADIGKWAAVVKQSGAKVE